jgi:hypothetical protein
VVRRLYTDEYEVQAARPVVLNGIEEVITRPDLADRAVFLTLGPITERQRRPEKDLWGLRAPATKHPGCDARHRGAWAADFLRGPNRALATNG